MTQSSSVLIIGAGIAGMTAALELAAMGRPAVLVEKKADIGGHAADYACKATDSCVKCGACLVTQKRQQVLSTPAIEVFADSRIQSISASGPFEASISVENRSPEPRTVTRNAGAVILAAGFTPFDASSKPYGYGVFKNVITNLELERMLQQQAQALCPSDGRLPERIAFIQCVGSRDAKLNHLWCSKVCCASALRMARWIRHRRPETEVTFFYIDVQTFGCRFMEFYEAARKEIRMMRIIPGDILATADDRLRLLYYDHHSRQSSEDQFDLVVLSIGMLPPSDDEALYDLFGGARAPTGFLEPLPEIEGLFTAGAVTGPMSIAEAVADGSRAAMQAELHMRHSM